MWSYFKISLHNKFEKSTFFEILKMEKISYRSYIQNGFKLGISAKQIHWELKKIDEDPPTIQTFIEDALNFKSSNSS